MVYGEGIIERLPAHSPLHDTDNDFRKVFINTVGALLDGWDVPSVLEAPYLQSASGSYLDKHGNVLGLKRRVDESDEHYRMRLVYETLGFLTVNYLLNIYELPLYVFVDDFDVTDNTLTSDNPYLGGEGFMSVASDEVQSILESKFIIDGGVEWLTV